MSKPTVRRRRDRFLALGVDGLLRDATRPPGKKPTPEDRVKALIALAMSPPPPHARHRKVDRHRPQEFLAFPDHVAEGIAPGTPVHVIPDNVSSHGSAEVRTWPKGRPDRTFRFTPTPASRMNAVEGFFPRLSRQRPKDAVFDSLDECITPVRSAGAGSRRISSRRAREAIGSFRKWHQMHESRHWAARTLIRARSSCAHVYD